MRKVTTTILFLLAYSSLFSQFEIGVKAGISSLQLAEEGLVVKNDESGNLQLNFKDAEYGVHFGLYSRVSFLGIYVEPAFLLNSSQTNYSLIETNESGVFESIRADIYRDLTIPVKIGIDATLLRLHTGPVIHVQLDRTSSLLDAEGFSEDFDKARYGWLIGTGLDLWKLRFDMDFQFGLYRFGDHIVFQGQQFNFSERPARVVFTLGYAF